MSELSVLRQKQEKPEMGRMILQFIIHSRALIRMKEVLLIITLGKCVQIGTVPGNLG